MIKLISVDNTVVWGNWDGTNKRTTLRLNTEVNATGYEKNGYSYIDSPSIGWVKTINLKDVVIVPPPVTPPSTLNLWRTKFAQEIMDVNYKPTGINYGSFAIMWLMEVQKIEKPTGWNLGDSTCFSIRKLNDFNSYKWNWLLDQAGTRKVLSQNEETQVIRLPVPCMSAGNLVNVLEETAVYCRIQAVPYNLPIDDGIRETPYLTHTWYAYKTDGTIYKPLGGVLWPLLAKGASAWVIKDGIAKI